MNSDLFFRAAIPEPFTVLGLNLRPFSAGHLILLHRIESAFVTGGKIEISDLVSSVFICSKNFRDGVTSLGSADSDAFMTEWQKQIGTFDFREKCELFARYISEGSEGPTYFSEANGGSINVPAVQLVKCKLISSTSITEEEFLDRPWALSLWDYLTIYSIDGHIQLVDSEAIDEAQSIADTLAERLNGKVGPWQN